MRKILIVLPLIVLLIWSSNYIIEQKKTAKVEWRDTIVTVKYNEYIHGKDSTYYVINGMHDTVDWWGYANGIRTSKEQMEEVRRCVDSLAYYFGYTPYIGYTLLRYKYYGRED